MNEKQVLNEQALCHYHEFIYRMYRLLFFPKKLRVCVGKKGFNSPRTTNMLWLPSLSLKWREKFFHFVCFFSFFATNKDKIDFEKLRWKLRSSACYLTFHRWWWRKEGDIFLSNQVSTVDFTLIHAFSSSIFFFSLFPKSELW